MDSDRGTRYRVLDPPGSPRSADSRLPALAGGRKDDRCIPTEGCCQSNALCRQLVSRQGDASPDTGMSIDFFRQLVVSFSPRVRDPFNEGT